MKINYLEITATRYLDQEGRSSKKEILKRVTTDNKEKAETWAKGWQEEISKKPTWWMTWSRDWNNRNVPEVKIEEKTIEIEEEL